MSAFETKRSFIEPVLMARFAHRDNSKMGHTIKKHYVYLYKSPENGAPVYVGKGWGDRAWSHIEIAKRNPEQHRNKYFARTLAKWLREGHKIEPQIVQIFETHEAALELEIELIRKYGRHNIKTGPLLNLTDGGEGTAGRGLQIEVDGVNYPTIREACLKYGQDETALRNRINLHGYTVRQAFGIDPPPAYPPSGAKAIKVAGIEFPTISAACAHYGASTGVWLLLNQMGKSIRYSMGRIADFKPTAEYLEAGREYFEHVQPRRVEISRRSSERRD